MVLEDVKIIHCGQKHYALLADLCAVTFREAYKDLHKKNDIDAYIKNNYTFEAIKNNLKNPDVIYFVVYGQFYEAGYMKLIKNVKTNLYNEPVLEIEKIYVLPQFYGKGFGQALMDKAIETAEELGYNKLHLGVWQENKRAIRFYEKNGFVVSGTRTFQLGSTLCNDYLMTKNL